jgi:hypothetical protein
VNGYIAARPTPLASFERMDSSQLFSQGLIPSAFDDDVSASQLASQLDLSFLDFNTQGADYPDFKDFSQVGMSACEYSF